MLTKLKNAKAERGSRGFTIIEVMIVLAIAGLILLIVFLAVPALQRNARNTTLKNDASAVAAGITEYVSNNDGAYPAAAAASISQSGATITVGSAGATVNAKVNGSTTVTSVTGAVNSGNIGNGNVKVWFRHDCTNAPNTRQAAVWYGVETAGGTTAVCIDD